MTEGEKRKENLLRKFVSIIDFMIKKTTNKKKPLTANSAESIIANRQLQFSMKAKAPCMENQQAFHHPSIGEINDIVNRPLSNICSLFDICRNRYEYYKYRRNNTHR